MTRSQHAEVIDRDLMERLIDRLPDPEARSRLFELTEPVVRSLASRFTGRGEPIEDLIQVASIGMLKAIDNFDPQRGSPLLAYATATIIGELRHYFRDSARLIRIPRRLAQAQRSIHQCVDLLTQKHGRSPSVAELAECAGLDQESVLEAIASVGAARPAPIDEGFEPTDDVSTVSHGYRRVLDLQFLSRYLAHLPSRERRIIFLRFFRGYTQAEVAQQVGLSQVQISRILSSTLNDIKKAAETSQESVG